MAPPNTIAREVASESSGQIRRAESTDAASGGKEDVTTRFEPWEIEFLAAKVFSYVKRKLEVDRERHGRSMSNPWL